MFVRTLKYEIALVCSWEKNKRKKEKLKLEINLFLLFTILIFDIVRKMVSAWFFIQANEEGFTKTSIKSATKIWKKIFFLNKIRNYQIKKLRDKIK